MSDPKTIVDAQLKNLLEIIEDHRKESCETIQARADDQAREIVKRAHRDARRKMHEQNARTREHVQRQLVSAEARLQTRKRLMRQQNDRAMLDSGWQSLKNALLDYWNEAEARKQWIDNAARLAAENFVSRQWHIEYPAGWDEGEKKQLQAVVTEMTDHAPRFTADDSIEAGLRILATGGCIDATIDGLLRDRARVESEMLTAIHDEDVVDKGNADMGGADDD